MAQASSPAGFGGVPPPVAGASPGGTPGELAGVDARATLSTALRRKQALVFIGVSLRTSGAIVSRAGNAGGEPPAPECDAGPNGFHDSKGPRALKKAVDGTQEAGRRKGQNEPPAASLQRVANQHGGNGEQSEKRQSVHVSDNLYLQQRPFNLRKGELAIQPAVRVREARMEGQRLRQRISKEILSDRCEGENLPYATGFKMLPPKEANGYKMEDWTQAKSLSRLPGAFRVWKGMCSTCWR